MRLFLDVGNSRIKWRHAQMGGSAVADDLAVLEAQWRGLSTPGIGAVFGSSVRGKAQMQAIDQLCQDCFRTGVRWQVSRAEALGVRNAYANPASLGVDRWLALLAAHASFPGRDCIVVDAGTAITVDLLDAAGDHRGGLIMPGARTILSSLGKAEQLFPDAGDDLLAVARAPRALTSNTQDALLAGAVFAVQGGVRAAIREQARQIGVKIETMPILLTGGDLGMLKLDTLQTHVVPDLVLDGLQVLAEKES